MSASLLVEFFQQLPMFQPGDDEELWTAGLQDAMRTFRARVQQRYQEGTLQRLLVSSEDVKARQAAALALGLVGTWSSVPIVAAALHDSDALVRRFAADSLWELWFRGGTPEQNARLREAMLEPNAAKARQELDALIEEAPDFAEAHNQRAIWYFKRGEFLRAVEDCETVLRLNPYHFGAAAGMGQCYLKLHRPHAALRAFRQAVAINPDLDLHDTIRLLEELQGE
ncbi:MAG: tetratricopeptide repeat protein [Gemmataceae bacterium]|nr:tetratricopeptide repeat protein [Gemmata sp.]MDW8199350.1 tetratricopeptide repeat protein [Gemmataceae bacterium]